MMELDVTFTIRPQPRGHTGYERFAGQELRLQVDREHPSPVGELDVRETLEGIDRGVVHQDVAAAEVRLHPCGEFGDVRG